MFYEEPRYNSGYFCTHVLLCMKYQIYTHHQYNIKIAKHSSHLYKLIWTLSHYGSLLVKLLKVSAKLLIMHEDMPTVNDHSFISSCTCRTDDDGMPSVSSVTNSLCKKNILLLLFAFILQQLQNVSHMNEFTYLCLFVTSHTCAQVPISFISFQQRCMI